MPQDFLVRNIFIIITGMVLVTGFAACKKQSISDPVSAVSIAEFETRLDNLRKGTNIPGVVAGIIKGGQIVWTKNYGYADLQKIYRLLILLYFILLLLPKRLLQLLL